MKTKPPDRLGSTTMGALQSDVEDNADVGVGTPPMGCAAAAGVPPEADNWTAVATGGAKVATDAALPCALTEPAMF